MRRDYFSLEVEDVDWIEDDGDPAKPCVTIDFEGPAAALEERFADGDEGLLDAEQTDVAFRLQDDLDAEDAAGVVSVTNRITGDFVLELNEDADDVLAFIRAARRYGELDADEDGGYDVRVLIDGEPFLEYEKRTFLVYNDAGNLLRNHSLIPSGVEL
ncbi:hypothetical protein L593_13365 [Salinarchaeum sp. Harcht-Bsk1]|uniref:DUF5793 family protein n=1 Tax=Salinarchaeum sp. Harcht-Bsk1 TaxID=1333523 RepID=UPI00034237D0|nr:DUF5793 family protein [Salinarchaeum sp. Harcht-Bsk1]AGN02612.1 hypothetical protein L593_13365 [Salinarchaeum sp. Harcht-Bsk1]